MTRTPDELRLDALREERRAGQIRLKMERQALRRIRGLLNVLPTFAGGAFDQRLRNLEINSIANAKIAIELATNAFDKTNFGPGLEAKRLANFVNHPMVTDEMFETAWGVIEVERVLKL